VAIQNFRLVLRCKRCQWNLTAPQSICKSCGIAPAHIIKRELDSEIECICRDCNKVTLRAIVPQHCIYCGSLAFDWWDYENTNWIAPNLKLKRHVKGIWLIGDFEGDFVGILSSTGLPSNLSLKENYHRDYDIKISRGHLINYRFTDRRPNLPLEPDPKPIRQDFSDSILVKDLNSDEYLPSNLADLVIYNWHRLSEKEFLDQNKIAGHIKGTLCACLIMEEEFHKEANPQIDVLEKPILPNAEVISNQPTEVSISLGPQHPSAKSLNGEGPPPPLPLSNQALDLTSDVKGDKWQHVRPILKPTNPEDCLLCSNSALLFWSILIFFIFRSDGKWADYFWCHLLQALFFISVSKAVCILGDKIYEKDWGIKGRINRKKYKNFLIGISLFSLLVIFSNFNKSDCFQLSTFGIWEIISLLCFVLSAFIRDCFTKTILALLFAFAVMMTMNCSKLDCSPNQSAHSGIKEKKNTNKSSVSSQLINTKQKIEDTVVEQTANYGERKVKALTGTDAENKKITTRDLSANPNILNDCSTSVYLGELGLFERNSFLIKTTAADKLEELAAWIAEQDKSKRFIITGHADQTGEKFANGMPNPVGYATNMRLSKQRANAIADYILGNDNINNEQLIVRGVGSSEPLTTDPDPEAQKMNIRVELKADCETDNKGSQ
jgi:outer membrane protein OmpA-like peptidoglycan-associated protein